MQQAKSIIACAIHDYFELACVYRYELKVATRDDRHYCGLAKDIRKHEGEESLELFVPGIGQELVALNTIQNVEVLSPNAQFQSLDLDTVVVA